MTQIIPADSKTFHHIAVTDKGLRKGYGCTRNRNHEQTISLFGSQTIAGIAFFTGDIAGSQPSRGWWPKNKRRVYGEERNGPERDRNSQEELNNCQPYLESESEILKPKVIVCLGRIAFEIILGIYSASRTSALSQEAREDKWKFGHGAAYQLENGVWILCSYHPSQQNTLTGKLTAKMFDDIWKKAKSLIE